MNDREFVKSLKAVDPMMLQSGFSTGERGMSPMVGDVFDIDIADYAQREYLMRRITPASVYLDRFEEVIVDSEDPPRQPEPSRELTTELAPVVVQDDEEYDFQKARKNIGRVADVITDSVEDAAAAARQFDSPGMHRSLCEVTMTAINANKEMLMMHELRRRMRGETREESDSNQSSSSSSITNNTNTTVLVGTAVDLNRMARQLIDIRKSQDVET